MPLAAPFDSPPASRAPRGPTLDSAMSSTAGATGPSQAARPSSPTMVAAANLRLSGALSERGVSSQPMTPRPLVLVHGYSDTYEGWDAWKDVIAGWDEKPRPLHLGNYISLSNEVTLKDVAEGFDRALRREAGIGPDQEFDAMVHSTGMLVVRAWLNSYSEGEQRRARLKHLVALAPATNGSPLAHKGRSWLGSIFKGNRQTGPDFLEAGDEILHGLELASKFTWDLAHDDMLEDNARFKPGPDTPFVFTFCGNRNYGFLKSLVTNEDGTDGTVRWAGCALNSRKIVVDMAVSPESKDEPTIEVSEWANQDHPLTVIDGLNHGTIVSKPNAVLKHLVRDALSVETADEFEAWNQKAAKKTEGARKKAARWQQFVIRVVDERGDPVTDWIAQLYGQHNARTSLQEFAMDVHVFKRDPSLRCFHVDLDELQPQKLKQLHLRVIASSGTRLVAYHGAGSERVTRRGVPIDGDAKWDARISLTGVLSDDGGFQIFYPFTTTFVEIRMNREPMPISGRNEVFWFPG